MDPTAAPIEIILDGDSYDAYPLRDIDHEALDKWVRREYIDRVRESIDDDPELARIALLNAATMNYRLGDGLRVLMTVAGVRKLAKLMCRGQKIPDEKFLVPGVITSVYEAYRDLHAIERNGDDGDESEGSNSDPN